MENNFNKPAVDSIEEINSEKIHGLVEEKYQNLSTEDLEARVNMAIKLYAEFKNYDKMLEALDEKMEYSENLKNSVEADYDPKSGALKNIKTSSIN